MTHPKGLGSVTDWEIEERVSRLLFDAGLKFEQQPSIDGLRPDFIVYGPEGQKVIVEVKAWSPGGGNTARALKQVERYREIADADDAFLVIPKLKKTHRARGVVNPGTLLDSLAAAFKKRKRKRPGRTKKVQPSNRLVFAAMPFSREYDDTYLIAMSYAAKKVNAACARVDDTEFSGDIVEEIKRLINESIAVIVDLSDIRANVLYEAGYAHALGKPTVHICSTDLSELPFDVRNWNTIDYNIGQTTLLRKPLARRLCSVIQ